MVLELLSAHHSEGLNKCLLRAIWDRRILLFDFLCILDLLDAILCDLERCLVGLHVCVGATELDIVENAPIQVLDRRQDQIVVQAEHIEGKEVSCLLRIACLSQLHADLEDQDRGVKRQVVELLSDFFRLLVELARRLFDAFQDVKADLDGVLASKLLIVLCELFEVGLCISKGLLDSALQRSDWILARLSAHSLIWIVRVR